MVAPALVFSIGNESRGDDALAPLLVRQLQTNRHGASVTPKYESACASRFPHPILPPSGEGENERLRDFHVECLTQVELIEDYQLQVEHVTDLAGRSAVLFVDADVSCDAPFHFSEIAAGKDNSYTSHAMTPFALLYTYQQVYGSDAPPAFLLRIRGYDFELGNPLSAKAAANLEAALKLARELCAGADSHRWRECLEHCMESKNA